MGFVQLLQNHIRPGPTLPSQEKRRSGISVSRFKPQLSLLKTRIHFRNITVPLGVILILPCAVIILIMIIIFRRSTDGNSELLPAGQPPAIKLINTKYDKVFQVGCADPMEAAKKPRANGAFVVLARNKELDGVIQSIRSIERHFNRWFHYPYVFLNDGDFNSTFKETVVNHTSAPVEFGKLNSSMWGYPDWVDKEVAQEGIRKQGDQAIMYGEMESYHHMCRFYSG
jgi:mannosyltransferase